MMNTNHNHQTKQSSPHAARKLSDLLAGIANAADKNLKFDPDIRGITDDSRQVSAGSLFVAVPGEACDGHDFIAQAVARGAVAVLAQRAVANADVPVYIASDIRRALAHVAARWNGLDDSTENLPKVVGITGTNGKSTTAYLLRSIYRAANENCGMLGTVEYDLVARRLPAKLTTPGALRLAEYIRECADAAADAVVLECSSHALDQQRTAGLQFAAGVFTNLSGDHLDYHDDIETYAAAKARLFESLSDTAIAVVNADDPQAERMIRDSAANVARYALDAEDADYKITIKKESIAGAEWELTLRDEKVNCTTPLFGQHNAYNAICAAATAHSLGVSSAAIVAGLEEMENIPGRLQRVRATQKAQIFVDYAHTDDALRNVASVLKPLTQRRLVCVFGCGGDRDKTKRPRMAAAAAELADAIIVTSDNPRNEDPHEIIADIVAGFSPEMRKRVMIEPDRRCAIRAAAMTLQPGDVLLIAGKGHEKYQLIGEVTVRFDDVEEAENAIAAVAGTLSEVG